MVIWVSLLAMSCIDAQNPFKDMSRAAVVVHGRSEIQDKDIIKKDKPYITYLTDASIKTEIMIVKNE